MIIAIDLTSLSYHVTGIERYAACVTEKMLELDKKDEFVLIFRDFIFDSFLKFSDKKNIKFRILTGKNKVIFYQCILLCELYKIKADKYIFFAFSSPIFFRKRGIYNTIHDMGPWDASESMKFLQKLYWRVTIRCSASASEGIITVSNFSKKRIGNILHYPLEKVRVVNSAVYEGLSVEMGADYNEIKNLYGLPDKYIMTLSTLEPRKNMILLLEAYSEIMDKVDFDLVLIGRNGWKMDDVIKKYNKNERIHITGFVEDKHVSIIYKKALCFIFPSLYEGFGLPPVEALAMGTPVIASDAASIPEILMNQATYFKCDSKVELKEILLHLSNNVENMPRSLNEYQKENYNFDTSAQKVLDYIKGNN